MTFQSNKGMEFANFSGWKHPIIMIKRGLPQKYADRKVSYK